MANLVENKKEGRMCLPACIPSLDPAEASNEMIAQAVTDVQRACQHDQMTITRSKYETIIKIGRIAYLAEPDAFDRLIEYAIALHYVRVNRGKYVPPAPANTYTEKPQRNYSNVKKPPVKAIQISGNRNIVKDAEIAIALMEQYEAAGWGRSAAGVLFGIAYEWGRINGKKERRKQSKRGRSEEKGEC